jgi:hypothetical protein
MLSKHVVIYLCICMCVCVLRLTNKISRIRYTAPFTLVLCVLQLCKTSSYYKKIKEKW